MKTTILILLTLTLLFIACDPYQFYLNQNKTNLEQISGYNMTKLDDVLVISPNKVILNDGGIVGMMINEKGQTQIRNDYTTELITGTGVRFALRSNTDSYPKHSSITFDYTTDGCIVKENNKLITKVDSIRAKLNEKVRIIIENYGDLFNIIVDCDTVYYGKTNLPATEYSIIQSLSESKVELTGVEFINLNSDVVEFQEY